jgi:hypothetical protein
VSAILALASVFGTEIEGYIWIIAILAIVAIAVTTYSLILLRRHHWGVSHQQSASG